MAVMVVFKSALGGNCTVALALAVLLAVFGSDSVAVALALLVMVPTTLEVNTRLTWALAVVARLPKSQVKLPLATAQEP